MEKPMSYDDAAAAEFYENEQNREPAGPPRKRRGQSRMLDSHVPVRFPSETIEAVKVVAAADGLTVSSWIRHLVTREIARRQVPRTEPRVVHPGNLGSGLVTTDRAAKERISA